MVDVLGFPPFPTVGGVAICFELTSELIDPARDRLGAIITYLPTSTRLFLTSAGRRGLRD